ncbi:MAG TPA: GMC family oxidoreductase [Nitrolancea sp.]|nr:GMC family oxidoreductase [Nitrolancea sp.]
MAQATRLPEEIDLLIVGGGTSGAALAGIVARDTDLNVVLLEAGPDYGPFASGDWPRDLCDARTFGGSHEWGYTGLAHPSHTQPTAFERARVLGGCSAHNGCVALLGHRRDYDHWAELGNSGWDWPSVEPAFARAKQALRVRKPDDDELTPFQVGFVAGAVASGIPRVDDLNDPDETDGVSPSPANIYEGTRWNTAFAYLDPVRDRPNLTIVDKALVDRVVVQSGRAVAVVAIIDGSPLRIAARRIVLASGAYGSPSILLRSGIGPSAELAALGIEPVHQLPGVGRALADHAAVQLSFRSAALDRDMHAFEASHWLPDEQCLLKTRSSICREAFDLHIYSVSGWEPASNAWKYNIFVSVVKPRSTGALSLTSRDPEAAPLLDHGFLSDREGHDAAVLVDGVDIARQIAAASPLADQLGHDERLGAGPLSRADLADFVQRNVGIYWHPACSCRMGPASDAEAVVDPTGKVHGLDGLYVCDASIFPVIMRANTNLPAAMLSEHLASSLGEL